LYLHNGGSGFLNLLTSAGGEATPFETGFLSGFKEGQPSLPVFKISRNGQKICYSIENMGVHHCRILNRGDLYALERYELLRATHRVDR
jgi:hypothetical protein